MEEFLWVALEIVFESLWAFLNYSFWKKSKNKKTFTHNRKFWRRCFFISMILLGGYIFCRVYSFL